MWPPEVPALKVALVAKFHSWNRSMGLFVCVDISFSGVFSKNRCHLMTLAQANSALLEAAAPLSEWLCGNIPSAH